MESSPGNKLRKKKKKRGREENFDKRKLKAADVLVQWSGTRREATRNAQRLLDAAVFWPLDGPMTFDDSDRL
jgi:ribosomal protein L27